jgi:putative Mg2+ transporter-C (MgtC) family protein
MAGIFSFNSDEFLNTFVSLFVALLLGTLIGVERQYRQRNAGLRTNALVALGASAFVDLGMRLMGNQGATQVLAYVASGVGFLGAGVILKEGMNIRGLNTAATIWCSAVTGAFAGADHAAEAVLMCGFVLAGNTFLRPLVNLIERAPIDESQTESTFELRVTTDESSRDAMIELIEARLDAAKYPAREIRERAREEGIEIVAVLAATSVEALALDRIVADLQKLASVSHATWASRATD